MKPCPKCGGEVGLSRRGKVVHLAADCRLEGVYTKAQWIEAREAEEKPDTD